ncbi:hypothetical protein OKA05_27900 [Luteolibacter arcticus]|uniref:AAA family ATPase n=1 Tax=Luteolibacter arcticus TaxID=1581411 RepID=A0ABT3GSE4_9BACT|nr:hypothetical protein [Luteolibacter arcticus]MCW1926407.1 hypothetical protein [Luteolibacter arcticus]
MPEPLRALITGGPGSGCTTTAAWIAQHLGLAHFDSDRYFHKPTDPPYQEQYSPEERRELITRDLGLDLKTHAATSSAWILSGSVASWGLTGLAPTHGILLDIGPAARITRLAQRERQRFGTRLDPGGDLHAEHHDFMKWAEAYELRSDRGRNLTTDHAFLISSCPHLLHLREDLPFPTACERVREFLESAG